MLSIESVGSGLCTLIGATLVYLATPHQKLMRNVACKRAFAATGAAMLFAAALLLMRVMGSATAVFTVIVVAMLLWSLPPLLIGWLRHRAGARP